MWRIQSGLDPNDWRPIPVVGAGVREIRLHTGREHRVVYVAKFAEAVYVLHSFEKKARRTSDRDLSVARERLRLMLDRKRRNG